MFDAHPTSARKVDRSPWRRTYIRRPPQTTGKALSPGRRALAARWRVRTGQHHHQPPVADPARSSGEPAQRAIPGENGLPGDFNSYALPHWRPPHTGAHSPGSCSAKDAQQRRRQREGSAGAGRLENRVMLPREPSRPMGRKRQHDHRRRRRLRAEVLRD